MLALALTFARVRLAHLLLLFAVLSWLISGVGFVPAFAVIFTILSCAALGTIAMRWLRRSPDVPILTMPTIFVGIAIWALIWGVMQHWPINYRALYIGMMLLPLIWVSIIRQGSLIEESQKLAVKTAGWLRDVPFPIWTLGLGLIGWVLRWTSMPSVNYDDQTLHLHLYPELLLLHRASFNVQEQIWAVAPFLTDLLHAVISLVAGEESRGATNLALALAIIVITIAALRRMGVGARGQMLLAILTVSTPLLGSLLISMQTELFLSVLGLAGFYMALDLRSSPSVMNVAGIVTCSALCAATKLPGAVLGVTLLIVMFAMLRWRLARLILQEASPFFGVGLLLILLIVALDSYIIAWRMTGNPVFPLYNAIFKSPFFPDVNFGDSRWFLGFSLINYLKAFFETSRFIEAQDYTAGWQFLLLLPIGVYLLFRRKDDVRFRLIAIPIFGFGLAMFAATQYWRYLFPVMPLAGIAMGSMFVDQPKYRMSGFAALTVLCIGANFYFFTGASWLMSAPAQIAFTPQGKDALISRYAPIALLNEHINRTSPGARVMYPAEVPYGATLMGTPIYVHWHAPLRQKAFNALGSLREIRLFLAQERVEFVILGAGDPESVSKAENLLREHVASWGIIEAKEGDFTLYRLAPSPIPYRAGFGYNTDQVSADLKTGDNYAGEPLWANEKPNVIARIPLHQALQGRYKVTFQCADKAGYFVAQINWNIGSPYYRLVGCDSSTETFIDTMPVPPKADTGEIYITARGTPKVSIKNMEIEFY
ncbi:hypothetical protein [Bordetella genomosp. 10]|nr:hypothetical protein [Bordetella genomosp. 10]